MLNFEKATALKKAHFPQPQPELGQTWYDRKGGLWIVGTYGAQNPHDLVFRSLGETSWEWPCDTEGFVLAPAEKDILAELQKGCRNGFWWALTAPDKSDNLWGCACFERNEGKNMEYLSESPAEACADAYLLSVSFIS